MERVIQAIRFIKKHFGKVILTLISALLFFVLLFPLNDLSDFITLQIAKNTNNQIYLQFDKISMATIPTPGVELENVFLETARSPIGVAVDQVKLRPSISGLIFRKPAGSVELKGLFKGDAKLSLSGGSTTEAGTERSKLEVQIDKVDLSGLSQMARLPMKFKGTVDMNLKGQADLAFNEQPEADMVVKIDEFELPPSNVETQLGPVNLPDVKLKKVELKGKLANGRFDIDEISLGQGSDEINGKIKGYINMQILNQNGTIIPLPGAYDLAIDLNMKKSFIDKASLFLTFIDQHKTATADGARYAFKVSGTSFQRPPSINPMR